MRWALTVGWLFHVSPVSLHDDVTRKTSWVRHDKGTNVTKKRSVASITAADVGIAGVHLERSKRR